MIKILNKATEEEIAIILSTIIYLKQTNILAKNNISNWKLSSTIPNKNVSNWNNNKSVWITESKI